MPRYIPRAPILKKKRKALADRIRRIEDYLRRGECDRAWLEYMNPIAEEELKSYGVAFKESTRRALRRRIFACKRKG